jgi:hypothetical protein
LVLEAISIGGQIALIVFLLRSSSFRRYPFLLIYAVVQLVITGVEEYTYRVYSLASAIYGKLYWTDEVIMDLLLFLMVIVLTYRAVESSSLRTTMGRLLGAIVVVVITVPFVLFSARRFSTPWFNAASQLLNFGAAIMNLVLWTALIATRKRDPLLVAVSAGLGVAVTGAAIAFGLRRFTPPTSTPQQLADLFKTITYLASLAIWCWAFRPRAAKAPVPPAAVNAPTVTS